MLKRAALVTLALLISAPALASEMESPIVTLSDVNWDAAAASLSERGTGTPAEAFARLNALTEKRFAGIAKSSVPVLLPFDIETFRRDIADGKPEAETSDKYFGDFHPTKFFLPGPAGYDATFTFDADSAGIETHFRKAGRSRNFRRGFCLCARWAEPAGGVHSERAGTTVSRHPPRLARIARALRVHAFRRPLRAVDPVLRPAYVVAPALLPARRPGGGALFAPAAHRRRQPGENRTSRSSISSGRRSSRIPSPISVRAI